MKKHVLFYDSECSLCLRFKKAMEFLDLNSEIEFVSIHNEEAFERFPNVNRDECFETIHLLTSSDEIITGGDVLDFLIKLSPGVKKYAWLLESQAARTAMDAFYNRLNDMRIMKKRRCFTCGSPSRKMKRSV